jgi:hypothetical protein
MGWKERKGRFYYYKTTRERGEVRTRYVGGGEVGELAAALDLLAGVRRRADRAAALDAERARLTAMAEADGRLARYCRGVELVNRAAMEVAGLHRHDRARWRKARMGTVAKRKKPAPAGGTLKAPREFSVDQAQAVMDRANAGDTSALPEIRELLNGDWREPILHCAGSPAAFLTRGLIKTFSGKDGLGVREAMEEQMERLCESLTPPDADPLERLLARRVALCWLAVCAAEYSASKCDRAGTTPAMMDALARRTDRAHGRLLSSVRALATFRKVDPPNILLNVAGQQAVSLANPAAAAALPRADPHPAIGTAFLKRC